MKVTHIADIGNEIRTLTAVERAILVNGMRVARERFERNARLFQINGFLEPIEPSTAKALQEQFEQQAKEAWELGILLDGVTEIAIEYTPGDVPEEVEENAGR